MSPSTCLQLRHGPVRWLVNGRRDRPDMLQAMKAMQAMTPNQFAVARPVLDADPGSPDPSRPHPRTGISPPMPGDQP